LQKTCSGAENSVECVELAGDDGGVNPDFGQNLVLYKSSATVVLVLQLQKTCSGAENSVECVELAGDDGGVNPDFGQNLVLYKSSATVVLGRVDKSWASCVGQAIATGP